jgi:putative membrane protein
MAKPVLIDLDEAPGQTPSDAPPVPDLGLPQGRTMTAAASVVGAQPSRLLRVAVWVLL